MIRRTLGAGALASALLLGAAASAGAQEQTYTVESGDTLWRIAQRFDTTVTRLAQVNAIPNPNLIEVGQELIVQPSADDGAGDGDGGTDGSGREYVVQPGDTLAAIAARFDTSVAVLAQANRIANVDLIHVGQVLAIPGSGDGNGNGNGDTPDEVALTETCEADRYTVRYPEGWSTNSGLVADECGWFDREPFEVPVASELVTDVILSVEPVDYDTILDGLGTGGRILSAQETTVAGLEAVRVETLNSGEGLLPEGTRTTQYVVRLGDGESFTASTHSTHEEYRETRDILDRMVETLEFR